MQYGLIRRLSGPASGDVVAPLMAMAAAMVASRQVPPPCTRTPPPRSGSDRRAARPVGQTDGVVVEDERMHLRCAGMYGTLLTFATAAATRRRPPSLGASAEKRSGIRYGDRLDAPVGPSSDEEGPGQRLSVEVVGRRAVGVDGKREQRLDRDPGGLAREQSVSLAPSTSGNQLPAPRVGGLFLAGALQKDCGHRLEVPTAALIQVVGHRDWPRGSPTESRGIPHTSPGRQSARRFKRKDYW
jgi:hypothetical protein